MGLGTWRLGLVCVAWCVLVVPSHARQQDSIQPFTIRVDDRTLADLEMRLANARIPEPLQGDGWTHAPISATTSRDGP